VSYVTLRNTSGEPLHLGTADGRVVDADEVVRVEGSLAKDQPEDAVVVGEGDSARAYPTSLWTKVATGKSGDADVTTPGKENS
jgi:hypothetical protein